MILTFKDLLELKTVPRVHGNGFIQIDLPEDRRLHIWPDEKLETQKVYTGIHNHRFSFESQVLLGTLHHTQFRVVQLPGGEYQLYKTIPRDREDKGLSLFSEDYFSLENPQDFYLSVGSRYNFPYRAFHDSRGIGLTATLMRKTFVDEDMEVLVLCPRDKTPDNEFGKYKIPQEKIWPIVKKVFDKIKKIEYSNEFNLV